MSSSVVDDSAATISTLDSMILSLALPTSFTFCCYILTIAKCLLIASSMTGWNYSDDATAAALLPLCTFSFFSFDEQDRMLKISSSVSFNLSLLFWFRSLMIA